MTDTALLEGELRRRSNLKASMTPALEGLTRLTYGRGSGVFRGSAEGNLHLQDADTGGESVTEVRGNV